MESTNKHDRLRSHAVLSLSLSGAQIATPRRRIWAQLEKRLAIEYFPRAARSMSWALTNETGKVCPQQYLLATL